MRLADTELPGSTFVVAPEDDRRYAEVVAGRAEDDESANPLWAFIAALTGTGLDITGLFALADCDVAQDGPMLGACDLEYARPLEVERPYRVEAVIAGLERKHGRSGAFDLMRVRAALSDEAGEVATCLTTYVIPRRQ